MLRITGTSKVIRPLLKKSTNMKKIAEYCGDEMTLLGRDKDRLPIAADRRKRKSDFCSAAARLIGRGLVEGGGLITAAETFSTKPSLRDFQVTVHIITKVVQWMYGESSPTSWIIENGALFKEYSRKLEGQPSRKEQHLRTLTTQEDSKSLTITNSSNTPVKNPRLRRFLFPPCCYGLGELGYLFSGVNLSHRLAVWHNNSEGREFAWPCPFLPFAPLFWSLRPPGSTFDLTPRCDI
ncbi:hypothetical protein AVEN_197321-1 [Araneus ventricosus]|uniref:Uncharacterized protein n=1 Tax=Araneus ventricosus TaxID=182803 RepID=A0A4Y2EXJ6_ARAVE|nr:hypothetical protein AVEN_197321-1 [Araneus ventricosus]